MSGFDQLLKNAIAEGALTSKIKELIALGIAISVRCDGCITFHIHDALDAEATRQEVTETIEVAIAIGGSAFCRSTAALITVLV